MKIKSKTLAIIIIIVMIGGIFSAQLAGIWHTKGQPGGPGPGKEIKNHKFKGGEKESRNIEEYTDGV